MAMALSIVLGIREQNTVTRFLSLSFSKHC